MIRVKSRSTKIHIKSIVEKNWRKSFAHPGQAWTDGRPILSAREVTTSFEVGTTEAKRQ
jgi:hypothetical protein